MKQSKDPFEAALEEQEESPPDSPIGQDELNTQTPIETQNPQISSGHNNMVVDDEDYDEIGTDVNKPSHPSTSLLLSTSVNANANASSAAAAAAAAVVTAKNKEYDDDEEEENVEVELSKFPSSADPDKMAKMQLGFIFFLILLVPVLFFRYLILRRKIMFYSVFA